MRQNSTWVTRRFGISSSEKRRYLFYTESSTCVTATGMVSIPSVDAGGRVSFAFAMINSISVAVGTSSSEFSATISATVVVTCSSFTSERRVVSYRCVALYRQTNADIMTITHRKPKTPKTPKTTYIVPKLASSPTGRRFPSDSAGGKCD